jgi:hypothetical protein
MFQKCEEFEHLGTPITDQNFIHKHIYIGYNAV